MGLYRNIKVVCIYRGINISELERSLGFPRSSIAKWDSNIPSVAKVKAVADCLGVTVDDLLKSTNIGKKGVRRDRQIACGNPNDTQ